MRPHLLSVRYRIHAVAIFILVLLITTGCCLLAHSSDSYIQIQIAVPILAVALAFILLSIPGKIIRNEKILLSSFFVIFILGIVVYHSEWASNIDFINAEWYVKLLWPVTSTLSVFFPSRGDYSLEGSIPGALYWIFHFLGYFYFAWIGMALLGRKLLNRASLLFIPGKYKNVIWGYSEVGFELAEDILNNIGRLKEEPVFVIDEGSSGKDGSSRDGGDVRAIFNKLCNADILAVGEDIAEGNNHIRGHRHYFITENQDCNVNMAVKVIGKIAEHPWYRGRRTHIFVRCELEGIDTLFQEKMKTAGDRVEIHIFNQSDLTARQFITRYPTLGLAGKPDLTGTGHCIEINHDTLEVSGCARILLLGLGWTGYELLRKTVCDTRYIGDAKIKISVIDDSFKEHNGRFAPIFAEARKNGIDIEVNPLFRDRDENAGEEKRVHKAGSTRFYSWLDDDDRILEFNRIIVALGDDELNTNTALDIHRFRAGHLPYESALKESGRMPEKIYAYVRDKARYGYYDDDISPIIPFGGTADIYTCEVLLDEKMDTVAKMVNYVYNLYDVERLGREELEGQLTPDSDMESKWSEASIFDQDSSRAVALNVQNMVTVCGGIEALERCVEDPRCIDILAEMEHLRWNAFHIMKGIKTWEPDEVRELNGKKNGKMFFYGALFRHICLLPFDRLGEANVRIDILKGSPGTDYRESDRRIVRHFPIFAGHIR